MFEWRIVLTLLVVLSVVVAFPIAAFFKGHELGKTEVQAEWEAQQAVVQAELTKLEQTARKKEQKLVAAAHIAQEKANEEKRILDSRYDTLLDSVRNRADRPAGEVSGATASAEGTQGCTGAELYRGDAEVLIRLAKRADELRILFKQYQDAHTAAKGEVSGE